MPTTPYAVAQISVNGGAPQQGGLTVAGASTIQLSLTNTSLLTSVRWEIYAYPSGWPTPSGWTLDASTGIIYSTDTTPTLITLEAATSRWGKWLVRCIGNGGTKNGVPPTTDPVTGSYLPNDVIDIASGWSVTDPNTGAEEPALYEGTQFHGVRRWAGALQATLKSLTATISGAVANSFGPTADPVISYASDLSTTDATPTAFSTGGLPYTMPDKTACDVVVTIVGKQAASANMTCLDFRARYYRNGGSATLVGAIIAGSNQHTFSTETATVLLSGNTIAPQVTGIAATSISWKATMQVQPVVTGT